MKILVVDPLMENDPDLESAAAGDDIELVFRYSVKGKLTDDRDYAEADALLNCRSMHTLPAAVIAKMPKCRAIQQGGVGYNHIDLDQAARQGITVLNTPDYGTTEVADHAVALALNLSRGIQAYDRRLRRSNDSWDARTLKSVRRLGSLRCGIIGLGRIGTAAALRFKAFGMEVGFYDPYKPAGSELSLGLKRFNTLESLLARSDVLSIHAFLSPETKYMINSETLKLLPEGAILINTARGGIVDFKSIKGALESNHLGGAAIDVFETEPLDRTDPLIAAWVANEEWLEERLIMTPHAAFYSTSSLRDIRRLSMSYLVDFLRTGRAQTAVNLEQLKEAARSRAS